MLWHENQPVALPPRAFSVLCHLVEHAGTLVTKDELLDAVWQHRFVSESVLKVCINELRRTLDDSAKTPRYIETVSRRGYRFIGAPKRLENIEATPQRSLPLTAPIGGVLRATDPKNYLLERAEPLAELQRLLERALAGERQVVFITGEAGIGKTTVVESFLEPLADRGVGVLLGRCIEHYGAGEAFMPLLEVFDRCCRATGGSGLIARLQRFAPTWLAQMPGLLGAQEQEELQREVVGATKERMLRELVGALEALSQELPLVLVLEDLHWSDRATLDAISLLAQRRDAAWLLVMGTYRPLDAALTEHPVKRLRQDLLARGRCIDLPLTPFSKPELESYLSARFPGTAVPDVVVDTVYGRTEGHPLFVANLIDDWTARGLIRPTDQRWGLPDRVDELALGVPERLRILIEHRIDALGQLEQRLLAVGSAVGEEWSAALVAAALDIDSVAAEECCEALAGRGQMIAQAGITEWPDGTVAGRYRFLHALYQEVLYQRLAAAQRVRIHKRLGERLAAGYGEHSHGVAAELADHFEQGCDYARALRYLSQAAENAARRYANREAVAYLSRALVLVDRLPPSEQVERRIGLLLRRVPVRGAMDDLESAIEDLKLVLGCARERQDKRLEINTLVEISRMARWLDIRYCLETAAEAEACSRDLEDEILKVRAQVSCAMANLRFTGWRQETAVTCRSALAVIRAAGDPRLINTLLYSHAWMECLSSNYALAQQVAEEGMEIARSLNDAYHFMLSWWFQLWSLLYLGKLGEARRGLSDVLSMAEKNGSSFGVMGFRLVLARLHEEALDFDGARGHCEQGLKLVREGRDHIFYSYSRAQHGGHSLILAGGAHLGLQDHRRAYECFSKAMRLVEGEPGITDWQLCLPLYQGLGEYWLAQGDLIQAREMATKLCAIAAPPPERTYLAFGHRLLAEIAMADGQWDQAEAEVAHALTAMMGAPAASTVWRAYAITPPECPSPSTASAVPLAAWRVHATAATLCERQGRPSEAEAFRQWSRTVIQELADSLDVSDPLRESLLAGHERVIRSTTRD
jgi:DNA-binding winged helix-turn-helix (wHTH) protein/tetratricopeptide (TPR) repeat protein